MSVLEIRNLHASVEGTEILRGVNLTLRSGVREGLGVPFVLTLLPMKVAARREGSGSWLTSLADLVTRHYRPVLVVMGIAANVGELHPNLTSLTTDWIVLEQIMDPLIILGPDGTFQPWLATEWEVSEDGLTWTFKLREGVTFHNGEPFNAEAVKFTVDDALNVEGSSQTVVIGELAEANVIDEYTIEMVTARPNPIWLSQIAHLFMMPPAYAAEAGPAGFNEAPIGTGAFTLGAGAARRQAGRYCE